jgi:hypothetical protein
VTTKKTASDPPNTTRSDDAYNRLMPEILAVPDGDSIPITVDIPAVITTVLGAAARILGMREVISTTFKDYDFSRLERLPEYALALGHSQALYRAAWSPPPPIAAAAEELTRTRDVLFSDAWALANHGFINPERLKECKTAIGYRAVAFDVLTLAAVIREKWSAVEGKTPLTLADLNQAVTKAENLLAAVGLKEQTPAMIGEASRIRQKAFTLFMNVYEDARRAIQYVRSKEGDADDIAPSLYAGRSRQKPDEPPPAPTPTPPVVGEHSDAPPAAVPTVASGGLPITQPYQS